MGRSGEQRENPFIMIGFALRTHSGSSSIDFVW